MSDSAQAKSQCPSRARPLPVETLTAQEQLAMRVPCSLEAGHDGPHRSYMDRFVWQDGDPVDAEARVKSERIPPKPEGLEYDADVVTWRLRPGEIPIPERPPVKPTGLMSKAEMKFRDPAIRDDPPPWWSQSDKAPLELVLGMDRAMRAVALQMAHGARKAGRARGDWAERYKGSEGSLELLRKLARHLLELCAGRMVDDSGQSHAAAIAANAMIYLEVAGGGE